MRYYFFYYRVLVDTLLFFKPRHCTRRYEYGGYVVTWRWWVCFFSY